MKQDKPASEMLEEHIHEVATLWQQHGGLDFYLGEPTKQNILKTAHMRKMPLGKYLDELRDNFAVNIKSYLEPAPRRRSLH